MLLTRELLSVADRIDYWARNPLAFVTEALDTGDLDAWQKDDFFRYIHTSPRITIRAGRGVAKSKTLAMATQWKLFCFSPSLVLFNAPKADTVQDVIWSEMEILRRRLPKAMADALVIQSDSIYIRGLERINTALIRTARPDNPDALRGAHSENMTIICEEASGIADSSFEVLEGSMTTPGSQMILVGNMSRTSGYFYDSHFNDKSNIWHKIHVSAETVAKNGHSWYDPSFVLSCQNRYGKDSDQYRVEVLGEPPSAEQGVVIPRAIVDDAVGREVDMIPGYLPVWGLDVGRDRDRSALAKRCGNVLLERIQPFNISNAIALGEVIRDIYDRTERMSPKMLPSEILVDVIGMGAPVLDILIQLGLPARGVNVSEAHSTGDRYLRKRDELWFRAQEWFMRRDVRIPDDPDFIGEISRVRYTITEGGKHKVEPTRDIKAGNSGKSPDLASAFILTFGGGWARLPEATNPERFKGYSHRGHRSYGAASWLSV